MADPINSDSSRPPVRAARPFAGPGSTGARSAITAAEIRPARLTRPPFRVRNWATPAAPPAPLISPGIAPAPLVSREPANDVPFRGLIADTSSAITDDHAAELEMIERGTPDALVGTPTGASDVFLAEANGMVSSPVESGPSYPDADDAHEQPRVANAGGAHDFDDDGTSAMADFELHVDAVDNLAAGAASIIDEALQGTDETSDEEWDTPWMAGLLAVGGVTTQPAPDAGAASPESAHATGVVVAEVFERLAHRIRGGEIAVPDRTAASGDAAVLAAVLSSLLLGRSTD